MTCQANAGSSLSSMPRFCLRGKSLFPFSSRLQVFVVRYMLCFLSLFGLSGCGDSSIKPPSSNFQSLASSSDNLGAGLTVKSVKGIRSRVIVKFRLDDHPAGEDRTLQSASPSTNFDQTNCWFKNRNFLLRGALVGNLKSKPMTH